MSESEDYLQYSALPNDYFVKCSSAYDGEREIFKVAQMEVYGMFGVPLIFYKTSYDIKYNNIWGEDGDRYITEYWTDVMSYFSLPKEDKIWKSFGIEDMQNFSMYLSKEHFNYTTSGYIPKMGDIVQTEYNKNIYEVVEVKEENGMYLLSKQYTWELIVRPFKNEQNVSLLPSLSASPIGRYLNIVDMFDIKNDVDVAKENKLYYPPPSEKPSNDPWGNWS